MDSNHRYLVIILQGKKGNEIKEMYVTETNVWILYIR